MKKSQGFSLVIVLLFALSFVFLSYMLSNDNNTQMNIVTKETKDEIETEFPIDLNVITKEQLLEIDGIGEKIADSIIEYRTKNGKFNNVEELINISGLGEKRIEKLKEYVYVENPVYTEIITTTTVKTTPTEVSKTATTTTKVTTAKVTTTKTTSKATTTTAVKTRTFVNINTASFEEIRDGLLLTDQQAMAIVELRNNIGYFSNPLEILYATKPDSEKEMFSFEDYNKFKDYVLIE